MSCVCVCDIYLEVPNGHRSINASSAELATVPLVSFIDRHLAANNKNIDMVKYTMHVHSEIHLS